MLLWLIILVLILLLCVVVAWGVARQHLSAPEWEPLPEPAAQLFPSTPDSPAAQAVLSRVHHLRQSTVGVPFRQRLAATRAAWENLFPAQAPDVQFVPFAEGGLRGEWVLPPGANPTRRTLYLHGGAYAVGSAHSHRPVTAAFARLTGGAVLALDYRLLPEHHRIDGIEDTRAAYRWLIEHGPQGPAPASALVVAGDSAGGNLTLALIAWARDTGLRAPTAAIAFSPQTDMTLSLPSWKTHRATDPMLGPSYGPIVRLPRTVILWGVWLQNRINPSNPVISPLFGDLHGLPPTLIQISTSEMLHDDGVRYAQRAQAAGSPVTLQVWPGMVHVWQLFAPGLPEAQAALDAVQAFIAEVEGRSDAPAELQPQSAEQA